MTGSRIKTSVDAASREGLDESVPGGGQDRNQEYRELKKLIFLVFASLVPITALAVITGVISGSLAIVAVAVNAGSSLLLHAFNMISIVVVLRQNVFKYPYGTGKLENFSGFLYAVILIPGALSIVGSAISRYFHPSSPIDFGLAQAMLVLSIIRLVWLLTMASRICKRFPDHSPMSRSYLVNMKVSLIYNAAILAGLIIGYCLHATGKADAAAAADLIIAVLVAVYMLYCAVGLLVHNFRSLIDLPLPEADQHKILNALTADFDSWEGIGNIYSQLSGSNRLIQIELHFNPATTVGEMEELRIRLEKRLRRHFGKLLFHLIPLAKQD